MKPLFAIAAILFCTLLGGWKAEAQPAPANPPAAGISEGLWKGSLTLKQSLLPGNRQSEAQMLGASVTLKILAKGAGALLDIPEQSMYGYPLDKVSWTANRISFVFDALGEGEELLFEGIFSSSAEQSGSSSAGGKEKGGSIIGTANSASWKGSFVLSRQPEALQPGETLRTVATQEGQLPGSYMLPASGQTDGPLVLIIAGAGPTDRNGNNFNVPGRTDSLLMLSRALATKGIASFRYDKRGSGEAYMLEAQGKPTSLTKHAEDAARVAASFFAAEGFSRLVVVGMNEGAWTGAAAIHRLAVEGFSVDGLVVLDASGEDPVDGLKASLAGLDETIKSEAESIVDAVLEGKPFPSPSASLSDFFAASRIAWLSSWLKFKPAEEIGRLQTSVLFIYGSSDLQVSREAFEKLLAARPNSAARLIPSMNYALKKVNTEEENYDSFTNPAYSLPPALVDLIAAFAKAKPLPSGSLPYEKSAGK